MTDPAAVAKWHETHMADRLAKLRAMSSDHMLRNVEFFGMKGPACTWLAMMNNHSIHHRGQLAAYLRAAGSKVPGDLRHERGRERVRIACASERSEPRDRMRADESGERERVQGHVRGATPLG